MSADFSVDKSSVYNLNPVVKGETALFARILAVSGEQMPARFYETRSNHAENAQRFSVISCNARDYREG